MFIFCHLFNMFVETLYDYLFFPFAFHLVSNLISTGFKIGIWKKKQKQKQKRFTIFPSVILLRFEGLKGCSISTHRRTTVAWEDLAISQAICQVLHAQVVLCCKRQSSSGQGLRDLPLLSLVIAYIKPARKPH